MEIQKYQGRWTDLPTYELTMLGARDPWESKNGKNKKVTMSPVHLGGGGGHPHFLAQIYQVP